MVNSSLNWDVQRGDILCLGARAFSAEDVARFSSKESEAVRNLCKKVLQSQEGNRIASLAKEENDKQALSEKIRPLSFAVGFKEREGLLLFVNGVKHVVATAEEVFSGKGAYLEELKQISGFAERREIGTCRKSSVDPIQDRAIQQVFETTKEERKKTAEAPVLLGRVETFFRKKVDAILEKIFGATDVVSVGRNASAALAPGDMNSFGVMAILGGLFLTVGGFYATVAAAAQLGAAVLQRNVEKGVLSFVNTVAGVCATLTGVAFLARGIAYFTKEVAIGALAGLALPFFVAGMYICGFFSSLYKIYVAYSFRREIQNILNQEGISQEKRLYEALKYIEQKTTLSKYDYLESAEKATQDKNAFDRMKYALHEKWDRFSLRVGAECYEVAGALLEKESSSELLQGILQGDSEKVKEGEKLLRSILDINKEQIFWSAAGAVYNLIGSVALIVWLCVTNVAGVIASSVIFAFAGFLSLFIDMEMARNLAKRIFQGIRDNLPTAAQAAFEVIVENNVKDTPIWVTLEKIRIKFQEIKAENERKREEESCLTQPPISSTSSEPREGFLPTPSSLTEETSGLSQAS